MSTPPYTTGDRPIAQSRFITSQTALIAASLLGLTVLAWAYLLHLATAMPSMAGMDMGPQLQPWGPVDAVFALVMWTVMMVGMMLPGASPVILLVARLPGTTINRTLVFGFGYLVTWTGFSLLATAVQGGLQSLHLLGHGGLTQAVLGGTVLIAAGLYQWSPAKARCLEHCRSPLGFLMAHWRPGLAGAWHLGLSHGLYCIGCCWMLMLLLFVGGVMNLFWAAGLAVLVLLEKLIPGGARLARLTGIVLVGLGAWMLIDAA